MSHCDRPERIRNPDPTGPPFIDVPCGKCYGCLQKKCDDWVFRIMFEERRTNIKSWFITLTYSDWCLPPEGVDKAAIKVFLKAVRDKYNGCKYALISEYGPTTFRPHYHMVLMHATNDHLSLLNFVNKAWKYRGQVTIEETLPNRIAYVAGYGFSKNEAPSGQEPNFRIFSNGIGDFSNEEELKNFINVHRRYIVRRPDGRKYAIPRYTLHKIYRGETLGIINQKKKSFAEKSLRDESRNYSQLYELQLWNDQKLKERVKKKKHI